MGHLDDPYSNQAFYLLMCKTRAERNLDKQQARSFLLANPLLAVSAFLRSVSKS
jgi:hypothetical protein